MKRRKFIAGLGALGILGRWAVTHMKPKLQSIFVGHGSPMNLVQQNLYTENFKSIGSRHNPSTIISVSAHWMTRGTEVTAVANPKQIFDFGGFPPALYKIKYEPQGDVKMAEVITQKMRGIKATAEWGLDHGTWAVLYHMYPKADIPTIQLSLNQNLKPLEHFDRACELRSVLQDQNVILLASGNLVHNLYKIGWDPNSQPHSWALEFESKALEILMDQSLSSQEKVRRIFELPTLELAHPTIEHLLPLIYALGAAVENITPIESVRGIQNASISMSSLEF